MILLIADRDRLGHRQQSENRRTSSPSKKHQTGLMLLRPSWFFRSTIATNRLVTLWRERHSLRRLCCYYRPAGARQPDRELAQLADPAVDLDRAAVLLGDDVPADRETEACPFARRLGREER